MKHKESNLQIACVRWFRLQYPSLAMVLFAVPNGGKRTKNLIKTSEGFVVSSREGKRMKDEGVTAGVADVLFLYPNQKHNALAIEFKTQTGRQSPAQKAWAEAVKIVGVRYEVVRGFEQFRTLICEYISDR